jgi:hypothetical protein
VCTNLLKAPLLHFFNYNIKRKNGKFEKCKVRLVVQGQHMHRKDEHGRGDFENAFSPDPLALVVESQNLCFAQNTLFRLKYSRLMSFL